MLIMYWQYWDRVRTFCYLFFNLLKFGEKSTMALSECPFHGFHTGYGGYIYLDNSVSFGSVSAKSELTDIIKQC